MSFGNNQQPPLLNNNIYNISTNHPLIPNSNDYIIYKKFVSIHPSWPIFTSSIEPVGTSL